MSLSTNTGTLRKIKQARLVDLTHSSLVKWVNISEPGRLARFFRCLISR